MLTDEQLQPMEVPFRTFMVIIGALILGPIVMGLMICLVVDWEEVDTELRILPLIGGVAALMMFSTSMLVPLIMGSSNIQGNAANCQKSDMPPDSDRSIRAIFGSMQSTKIISSAMVEGAVFLNLTLFMIDKSLMSLAVAGLGLGLLIITFPFRSRMVAKLNQSIRDIKELM